MIENIRNHINRIEIIRKNIFKTEIIFSFRIDEYILGSVYMKANLFLS